MHNCLLLDTKDLIPVLCEMETLKAAFSDQKLLKLIYEI